MVVYSVGKLSSYSNGAMQSIEKIHYERTKNTIKCKCGHSIPMRPCIESVICRWCGCRVFRDKDKQIEHDKENARRKFKEELRRELKFKELQALQEHLEQKKEETRKLYDDRTN